MAVAKTQYMKKTKEQKDKCRVLTPKGRLSYPFIFEPAEGEDGKKKYRTQLLLPKKNKRGEEIDYKPVHAAIRNCKTIVFGADKTKWPKNLGSPIRDGDSDDFKEEDSKGRMISKPGYKGHWVLSASSNEQAKPTVVDLEEEPIEAPSDLYPGCYARLSIMAQEWTWKKKQGIMFVLDGVQKLADGEPFGEKKSTKDMFKAPLSDDDMEDIESDDDEDEDDEDDAPKAKKKKRPVDDDDTDEDDDDDEEDSDEDSDDEDADDSDDDDEPPPRKKKATTKKKRPVDDDEDDE